MAWRVVGYEREQQKLASSVNIEEVKRLALIWNFGEHCHSQGTDKAGPPRLRDGLFSELKRHLWHESRMEPAKLGRRARPNGVGGGCEMAVGRLLIEW